MFSYPYNEVLLRSSENMKDSTCPMELRTPAKLHFGGLTMRTGATSSPLAIATSLLKAQRFRELYYARRRASIVSVRSTDVRR